MKEQLLAIRERDTAAVEVAGKTFTVRSLMAGEMLEYDEALKSVDGDLRKTLAIELSYFISDEAGVPLLSVDEADTLISNLKAQSVSAIVRRAMVLNGLAEEAREELKGN